MKQITVVLLLALASLNAYATNFLSPAAYEHWEAGTKVKVHLVGGYASSADLRLVDNGGYMSKNLGYIAQDFKYDEEQVFEWIIWNELPPGDYYQLAFHPKIGSGQATTSFSHPFTITANKTKQAWSGPTIYDESYYFRAEADL